MELKLIFVLLMLAKSLISVTLIFDDSLKHSITYSIDELRMSSYFLMTDRIGVVRRWAWKGLILKGILLEKSISISIGYKWMGWLCVLLKVCIILMSKLLVWLFFVVGKKYCNYDGLEIKIRGHNDNNNESNFILMQNIWNNMIDLSVNCFDLNRKYVESNEYLFLFSNWVNNNSFKIWSLSHSF